MAEIRRIHIDRLVLDGVPPAQRQAVTRAIQQAVAGAPPTEAGIRAAVSTAVTGALAVPLGKRGPA
jgi:hypothetical protein